ncbi:MAG: single-stranded DNA-binding protein, partial [Bullifex sp.]
EIRYSQGGEAVVRFSVAVNRRKRNADGSWEDEAHFFNCVYFGKSAEGVNQYLTKGRQVAINGELRQNRYEVEGQNRSTVEIFVNNLQLIGGQNPQSGRSDYSEQPRQGSYQRNTQFDARTQARPQQNARAQVPAEDSLDSTDFSGGPENYGDDPIPF